MTDQPQFPAGGGGFGDLAPDYIEMSVENWKTYMHIAKTENHRAEMAARKKRRDERVVTNFAAIRAQVNAKRVAQNLRPLRDPVKKYPGFRLRLIRAEKTNWRGELRR